MWKFLTGMAALALMAGCAQVSGGEYRRAHGQYSTSNGLFQRLESNGWDLYTLDERGPSLGKAVYEDFSEYGDGDDWCQQIDGTGCSGTAGEINLVNFPSGNKLACHVMGTQTILGALDMDAGSLDISGDQTENDGVECAWGTHGASGGAYVPGTDPAFFTCMQVSIANVSGTDEFYFGFRRADDEDGDVGGFNAAIDNYHDFAAWSLIEQAATQDLHTSEAQDDTVIVDTDSTVNWADAGRFDLCLFVSAAGVATFYYDNVATAAASFSDLKVAPTTTTYTFTDAEPVIPFFHMLQAATAQSGEIDVHEWVAGYGTFPLNAADDGV